MEPLHDALIYGLLNRLYWSLLYTTGMDSMRGNLPFLAYCYKCLDRFLTKYCDTKCPNIPWPSATANIELPSCERRLVLISRLSWFVLFGFVTCTPCFVLYAYFNSNFGIPSLGDLFFISFIESLCTRLAFVLFFFPACSAIIDEQLLYRCLDDNELM